MSAVTPLALVVVSALAPSLAGAAPAAGPVYAGVAARDATLEAQAEKVAIALGQALDARGAADLGSPPLPEMSDDGPDAILDGIVKAARSKYLEGDFAAAVAKSDEAITRFEGGGAFRAGPSWTLYGDALVVRALGLRRLGKEGEADASLSRLCAVMPRAYPDPGITPPKIAQRHLQLLDELKGKPRVSIEVESDPPGAAVVVDGQPQGRAPLVVKDLLAGTHFVALSSEGDRVERKVTVTSGTARVDEKVGDPRTQRAKALREALASPVASKVVLDRARELDGDVLVGALVADEAGPVVVLARAKGGTLKVVGARLDSKASLKQRAAQLADAVLDGKAEWVGGGAPSSTPESVLVSGLGGRVIGNVVEPPAEPPEEGPPWVLIGVGAGVAVAAATAVVIGALAATASANAVEVTVDASQLNPQR